MAIHSKEGREVGPHASVLVSWKWCGGVGGGGIKEKIKQPCMRQACVFVLSVGNNTSVSLLPPVFASLSLSLSLSPLYAE